jgi:hypothetical protein
MSTLQKRAYSRKTYEAPIMYINYDTENYCPAKMYNPSLNGMYFESQRALQPESDICIKSVTHLSEEPEPEVYEGCPCRARVKWCEKFNKRDIPCYGIGIQYLAESHTVDGAKVHRLSCSCDLCGEKVHSEEILEIEDFVHLCNSCFNNPKIPDRFLILVGQDFREGTELIDWSRFFCMPQHLVRLSV